MIDSANPRAIVPKGRMRGCRPRKYLPGVVCRMASEKIVVVPRDEWPTLAKQINQGLGLEPLVKTVLDQNGNNSCASAMVCQAAMVSRAFQGREHVVFNDLFLYHHVCGGRDQGSSIDENLKVAMEIGLCPESVWPRSKGWRVKPPQRAYDAAAGFKIREAFEVGSIDEGVTGLLTGYGWGFGADGHAYLNLKYLDETKASGVNSWGRDWGTNGFGVWAAFRAINFAYGSYLLRW